VVFVGKGEMEEGGEEEEEEEEEEEVVVEVATDCDVFPEQARLPREKGEGKEEEEWGAAEGLSNSEGAGGTVQGAEEEVDRTQRVGLEMPKQVGYEAPKLALAGDAAGNVAADATAGPDLCPSSRVPLKFEDEVIGMGEEVAYGTPARPLQRFEPWSQSHDGTLVLNPNCVLFTWCLVQSVLMTGTVDLLATFVTTMFLLAFCILNFICLLLELSRPRYWEPSFRMYSKWTAGLGLAGSLLALLLSGEWYMGAGGVVVLAFLLYWRREDLIQMQREGESHTASEQSRLARVHGRR
jgi:hypothetical protein